MWGILDKATETKVDTGLEIVKCISLLHNITTGVVGLHDSSSNDCGSLEANEGTQFKKIQNTQLYCRSQWPCGLRRRSTAARLLRLWVRIPAGTWMFVCCECCVLSGRGLCDGLITRPEESYRLWRVLVCDQETSRIRRVSPLWGCEKYNHTGL